MAAEEYSNPKRRSGSADEARRGEARRSRLDGPLPAVPTGCRCQAAPPLLLLLLLLLLLCCSRFYRTKIRQPHRASPTARRSQACSPRCMGAQQPAHCTKRFTTRCTQRPPRLHPANRNTAGPSKQNHRNGQGLSKVCRSTLCLDSRAHTIQLITTPASGATYG